MIRAGILCLIATPLYAAPVFEDRSLALGDHRYTGGWEHFVGGGVSVFDCNGDDLPDIWAARRLVWGSGRTKGGNGLYSYSGVPRLHNTVGFPDISKTHTL